ncbi:MAG TPA: flippase [Ilumatobacter sp.]|nr:flippase [Ilumatobacter sp.]
MSAHEVVEPKPGRDRAVKSQIRGSSVLMVGRVASIFANLLIQALIARELTKGEFGQFAYALTLVTMISTFITLGIDRAVPRFVAMYDERREWGHLGGTLLIQLSTILSLGGFAIIAVIGLQSWVTESTNDPGVTAVLVVLVFLAPIEALDQVAVSLFAVYAKPSAIFVRRYLMTPAMRLVVVALVVVGDRGPRFLAAGYVVTGAIGVLVYGALLWRLVQKQDLVANIRSTGLTMPWRAVLGYSLPLLTSDLLFAVVHTSDVVLLGRYHDSETVAAYRVVLPAAKLNQFVMASFALLFVPVASRMLARGDRDGLTQLYWRTAAWIAVATFPLFALTFTMADDLTAAMFGEIYRSSGTYLSLLALGYYFNAAMGFNGLTVKTAGRVGYTLVISLIAVVTNIVLNLLLIPEHGALGATIATLITLITHNVLKQLGLRLGTGVPLYPAPMMWPYAVIVTATVLLYSVFHFVDLSLPVGMALIAVVSLGVLRATRSHVDVLDVFPEIGRLPGAARLFGRSS